MPILPVHRPVRDAIGEPTPKIEHGNCVCWVVELTKGSPADTFGLEHTVEGPMLAVRRIVEASLLDRWNTLHPDAAVTPTDRIFRVNESMTIQEMQDELHRPAVQIHVARFPERFLVEMQDSQGFESLGVQLRSPSVHRKAELKIAFIKRGGLLDEWNKSAIGDGQLHFVVAPGMRIEVVNEVYGDAGKLQEELGSVGPLRLWIRRAEVVRTAFQRVKTRAWLIRKQRLSAEEGPQVPMENIEAATHAARAAGHEELQESTLYENSSHPVEVVQEVPSMPILPVHRPVRDAIGEPTPKIEHGNCVCWVVELTKGSPADTFGLEHTVEGPMLAVRRIVEASLLDRWNTLHPDAAVTPTDRIFRVNESMTIQEMQDELHRPAVQIHVARFPERFLVEMQDSQGFESLGVQLRSPSVHRKAELKIAFIKRGGLLDEWNKSAIGDGQLHFVVAPGMRIEVVNEVYGDAGKLQEELGSVGPLRLWIRRAEVVRTAFQRVKTRAWLIRKQRLSAEEGPQVPMENIEAATQAAQVSGNEESKESARSNTTEVALALFQAIDQEKRGVLSAMDLRNAVLAGLLVPGPASAEAVAATTSNSDAPFLPGQPQDEEYLRRAAIALEVQLQRRAAEAEEERRHAAEAEMERRRVAAMELEKDEEEDWHAAMMTLQEQYHTIPEVLLSAVAASNTQLEACETWEVTLSKENGRRFGFMFSSDRVDYQDARGKKVVLPHEGAEMLRVKEIAPEGAVADWNASNADTAIRKYDRIASINGKGAIDEMQQILRSGETIVRMHMVRYPQYFFADLKRGLAGAGVVLPVNASLGIGYEKSDVASSQLELIITKISQDGLLERWNKRNISKGRYQFVVTVGMRIEAVNDVEGSLDLMEQELCSGRARRLRIRRVEGKRSGGRTSVKHALKSLVNFSKKGASSSS